MFGLGFSELVLLGLIGLIFIKPQDLPKLARSAAKLINDLKRASSEVSRTLMDPVEQVKDQIKDQIGEHLQGTLHSSPESPGAQAGSETQPPPADLPKDEETKK